METTDFLLTLYLNPLTHPQILADAILPLPRNPMSGVVSPPLLATTGIVPCSIFSTGPDIIEHYCDCIVAARREVILLTNYWQGGKNVNRIADALRELNKRVQERVKQGSTTATDEKKDLPVGTSTTQAKPLDKIIVKVMWDRGPQTLADLFRCRKPVPPSMWESNGLPRKDEIPYLDMEILNYHRPLMGTFHAKLLLVDRQVALINSNNIQDRPNVEACTRLEGDIVNSIYDHALISWGNALQPPLPCLGTPSPKEPSPSAFVQGTEGSLPAMSEEKLRLLARQARLRLHQEDEETEEDWHMQSHGHGPGNLEGRRRMSFADVVEGMMKQHHAEKGAGTPSAGEKSAVHSFMARRASADANAGKSAAAAGGEGSADPEKAARLAGTRWAAKVLGDRWHGAGTGVEPSEAGSSQTAIADTTKAAEPPVASANDASAPATPHLGSTPGQSAQGQRSRHLADVVEAYMKKEGIKPALWAEGALDTLGLGPSSSRNVAEEAHRSRESRQRHAPPSSPGGGGGGGGGRRDVSIPRVVAEEPPSPKGGASADAEPSEGSQTVNGNQDAPPSTGISKEGRAEQEKEVAMEAKMADREPMSSKLTVPDPNEGAPGSVGYRQQHKRTLSNLSRTSASQRLAQITKSLDFANLSQVKGEIKADQLSKYSKTAAGEANGSPGGSGKGSSLTFASMTKGGRKGSANAKAAPPTATTAAAASSSSPLTEHPSISTAEMDAFAEGAADVLDFRPYVFHAPHDPVPMALMNRRPHGTPGHSDIRNPQDAAWLAGFRYAKEHIFIQSPTLNATPIKAAVLAAARRHVRVELWLDLGFNDKSESMPFQGGTNEQVVTRLYRQLRREGKGDEKYLEVFWYTGKDMTRPLNAVRKQRNCHVKYAAFDGQVAILGSGNQDTQSWFHSQEINVCVDSRQIVKEWDQALRRNQSTGIYGRVDDDGIWRGRSGVEVADTGKDPKTNGGANGANGATSGASSEKTAAATAATTPGSGEGKGETAGGGGTADGKEGGKEKEAIKEKDVGTIDQEKAAQGYGEGGEGTTTSAAPAPALTAQQASDAAQDADAAATGAESNAPTTMEEKAAAVAETKPAAS